MRTTHLDFFYLIAKDDIFTHISSYIIAEAFPVMKLTLIKLGNAELSNSFLHFKNHPHLLSLLYSQ